MFDKVQVELKHINTMYVDIVIELLVKWDSLTLSVDNYICYFSVRRKIELDSSSLQLTVQRVNYFL